MESPNQREEDRSGTVVTAAAPSRAPPVVPSRIGRFAVLEALGSGGMGVVCAAYDAELDRKVAIKLLRPQIASSGKSSLAQARLLREAQAMARLSHPNVITVHEVGTHGDQVFIAMEFLVGITLKQWLRRARRPWPEVLAVFQQAGRGLAAAHAAGLIHRDFKPDNVMVTEDPRTGRVERVRVFDFGVVQETREAAMRQSSQGIVTRTPNPDGRRTTTPEPERRQDRTPSEETPLRRVIGRSLPLQGEITPFDSQESASHEGSLHGDEIYATGLTAAGALVGTPLYMAPEQYEQIADARSDQFSFCAALFEALYRRRPFGGDTPARLQQAKLTGALRRPPRHHDVPAWLHRVVVRGLATHPGRRYPSMEALLAELERETRPRQPLAMVAIVAAFLLFGLGATLAWSFARGPGDPCLSAASGLGPLWNAARREQMRASFRGSSRPYADAAFATVAERIDSYVELWTEQRVAICRAAGDPQQGPELAVRSLCLEQRREELGALVEQLERADGEVVDNAVHAAAQLQPIGSCDAPGSHHIRTPPPAAELQADVRALEHRLAELRALEQTGKYATGLDLASAAVRDARVVGHPPLVAEALLWQGVLHGHMSDSRAAEAALREAALLAEESRHDEVFARAATELVRVVGVEQERHGEGMLWSDLAGAALRRVGDASGEVTRQGYLGRLHEVRGELRAAQAAYGHALERARNTFPEEHPQVATALDDLAGMQLKQGNYSAAQANYAKVLQIRRITQGPGHPRVAEALGHLGRVAAEQGKQEEARGLFEQALGICDALRTCSPAGRAEALVNLGRAEFAVGRHAAAQALHEEALGLFEGLYGREHSKVAGLLLALGVFARTQERFDEAAAYYQRALAIQRRLQAEDHPAMVAIHVNLGALAMARGRLEEARNELERALAIHEKNHGFENFGLAEILDHLGAVARLQGRVVDAIAQHVRARQIYLRHLGDAHPDVVRVTLHLAEDQLAHGDVAAAEALLDASLSAQEQVGASSEALAATRFLLARTLVAGRHTDAGPRRQRARALAESALAAERLTPTHRAQVDAITAWLRTQPAR